MATAEVIELHQASPLAALRAAVKEAVADREEYTVKELQAEMVAELLRSSDFTEEAARLWVVETVPGVLASVEHDQRRKTIRFGSGSVSAERFEVEVVERFGKWMETVGVGQRKSLPSLRRPELRYAIDHRREQVRGELRIISWQEDIYRGMKNDRQTVGEIYDEKKLASLWSKHFREEE